MVDSNDNILVVSGEKLRKITPSGNVTSVFTANTDESRRFLQGSFNLIVDSSGHLYSYSSTSNDEIGLLKMTMDGYISLVSEIKSNKGIPFDSSNLIAGLFLTLDSRGNIFLADFMNSVIRKFQSNGQMVNIGKPIMGALNNKNGLEATFAGPADFVITSNGTILITDTLNEGIRSVDMSGSVSNFSGGLSPVNSGFTDGNAHLSRFKSLSSIVHNSQQNNFYVVDQLGTVLRRVLSDGSTSTFAGGAESSLYYKDGQGNDAKFNRINAMTMNQANTHLYLIDGNKIRKVDMNGVVKTIVNASEQESFSWNMDSIVADSLDNIYVVDQRSLQKITSSGVVTKVFEDKSQEIITHFGLLPSSVVLKSVMAIDKSGNFYLQYCTDSEQMKQCDIRKYNAQTNTLTNTGIQVNDRISAFKFDHTGQAFALTGNGLYKAQIN